MLTQSETNLNSAFRPEFPKVIGEYAGVFLVQTASERGRLFDVAEGTVFPEGGLQPLLARAPYSAFDDKNGEVLELFIELTKDD